MTILYELSHLNYELVEGYLLQSTGGSSIFANSENVFNNWVSFINKFYPNAKFDIKDQRVYIIDEKFSSDEKVRTDVIAEEYDKYKKSRHHG